MEQNYHNYEYMTKTVNKLRAGEAINRYASLGWEIDGQSEYLVSTTLTFRRDRRISNREQLNRMQLRIEDCANEINRLEESKVRGPSIFISTIGTVTALIFGGGLCLTLLNPPAASFAFIMGIILGVIGMACAALIYPAYRKVSKKKEAKTNPFIEKKIDEMSDLCQEAHNLTAAA